MPNLDYPSQPATETAQEAGHPPQAATEFAPPLRPVRSSARRFASFRNISALMLREMSTRYSRTPGGYLWNVLEPLAAVLFLSLGFSLFLRSPALGTSFLLFYATGYMPFDLYGVLSRTCAAAINFSRSLLKFPAVSWVDALLARFFLNSLTGILNAILLLGGILIVVDHRAVLDLPPILHAMGLAMILGLGVGAANCVLTGLFPLWALVWGIVNRPLFIASGIFFLFDEMSPTAQAILWYNPLVHIVGLMRTGFYPTYTAAYVSELYVLFVALTLLTLGLILIGRYHRDIINN
ncbi:sugar ABC transporter permease [Epibacterium sp. SM1979]|uniref:Sugar ABC transporter permease n=1 Tax=Tritonibacter litoralis TaxID=2662264 RepID=A0A843YK27_9RHOB|nr:ABC transporter permease [Tritonibacter litoralis]MQQ09612.1 sugar ABC transporter permease [Tritonibacter litoralis]